jgi:hypothetical protein
MLNVFADRIHATAKKLGHIIADAWRRQQASRKFFEFARLYPNEVGRIAHDLGMTTPELLRASVEGEAWRRLLNARLLALGIEPNIINVSEPEYTRDLERICTLCDSKTQCTRDLNRRPESGIWRTYCPNASTLDLLARDSVADCMIETISSTARI